MSKRRNENPINVPPFEVRDPGCVGSFLFTRMHYKCLEYVKANRRRAGGGDDFSNIVSGEAGPDDAVMQGEVQEVLEQGLASLSNAERRALIIVQEMPFREAAPRLGLTLGKLNHLYRKALRKLAAFMKPKFAAN